MKLQSRRTITHIFKCLIFRIDASANSSASLVFTSKDIKLSCYMLRVDGYIPGHMYPLMRG